ncbi:Fasciclin-3 [Papilio machaon]|uniref:Fasciclin-3 n=1 Tax=Papilio machaon TaxID=76193 RepID=A0A194RHR4_PAPMA|nr:Fasciclin-3 [Papilio machaon]
MYRHKNFVKASRIIRSDGGPKRFELDTAAQNVEITPLKAVRRVGDELIVLCKVPYRIDSCRMTVGPTSYRLIPNNQGDVVYHGQGLEVGECGAQIKHIKEEWNGNISCVLPPKTGSIEVSGTMQLLVARAPGDPQLISPPQASFKEGDIFMAQCIVPNGRPAAKITWFLDDEQVLAGTHQPIVTSEPGSDLQTIRQNVSRALTADDSGKRLVCRAEHESLDQPKEASRQLLVNYYLQSLSEDFLTSEPGSDLQTIRQNVSRALTAEDSGKRLVCRAEHESLDQPKEASRQLLVNYPPKRLDDSSSITIFGLKIAEEGRLNVTVRANPRPHAEWTVGDVKLTAPQKNEDASIEALEPVHLGGGYYNVTLVLSRVAKEDVDRTYYLTVANDLGREDFSVRLSTMDEPAGVELETGAIVGIVIAVLFLLISIFLVVFAKATDRWCFAGRSHRTDIPDGADSEAPLPPHDDVKGSENPSHDHGEYISNGDTKHPEKKPDTAV